MTSCIFLSIFFVFILNVFFVIGFHFIISKFCPLYGIFWLSKGKMWYIHLSQSKNHFFFFLVNGLSITTSLEESRYQQLIFKSLTFKLDWGGSRVIRKAGILRGAEIHTIIEEKRKFKSTQRKLKLFSTNCS